MDIEKLSTRLGWFPPGIIRLIEKRAKKIPAIKEQIEAQNADIMMDLRENLKPYTDDPNTYQSLPPDGVPREKVLEAMRRLRNVEQSQWEDGFVSGAVYHGELTIKN